MKIIATTQITENYGTSEDPFWKMKGGRDFAIPVDLVTSMMGRDHLQSVVDLFEEGTLEDNMAYHEYVIHWELVDDEILV